MYILEEMLFRKSHQARIYGLSSLFSPEPLVRVPNLQLETHNAADNASTVSTAVPAPAQAYNLPPIFGFIIIQFWLDCESKIKNGRGKESCS